MTEILAALGTHTLGGAIAVIILSLISQSRRVKLGAKWRCLAWILLCLRLALPLPLLSNLHIAFDTIQLPALIYIPLTDEPILDVSDLMPGLLTSPINEEGDSLGQSQTSNHPSQSSDKTPIIPQTPASGQVNSVFSLHLSHVLFGIWLIGAAAMTLWILVTHRRFLHYLRRWAVPANDSELILDYNRLGNELGLNRRPKLLVCPGLPSPMLSGVLQPVLLLPERLPLGISLHHAILHELIHYRHRHLWIKALVLWVNIIHWFNPLMWYMVQLVERDIELACDEATLHHLPPEEYRAYGLTILNTAGFDQ